MNKKNQNNLKYYNNKLLKIRKLQKYKNFQMNNKNQNNNKYKKNKLERKPCSNS